MAENVKDSEVSENETTKPMVSILIPSYNHAQYIEIAIQSALDQTYPSLEVIVIDDGSEDNTHDVVRQKFGDHPKVKLILNAVNRGQSAVMNQGLAVASGEYICQLASDDWLLPEKLALQVAKFQECSADVGVVYGRGYRYFEDTGEVELVETPMHRGDVLPQLAATGNFIFPMAPMFRREVFDKVRFDENYTAQGEAIYVYISLYFEFDYVDQPVAVMRDHSYNTGKQTHMLYEEIRRYWENFFNDPSVPDEIRRYKKSRMRKLHRTKGFQFIGENHDFTMGRRCLINAVRTDPALLFDPKVVGGIALCYLPEFLAKKIVSARRYRPETQTGGAA